MDKTFKVAAVQDTPVLFDLQGSLQKTAKLVTKAASMGAGLVVFPESFLPGYPRGLSFGAVIGSRTEAGRSLYHTYWENSVAIPGEAAEQLAAMAKDNHVYLVIGVTEKDSLNKTLYCTTLYFSPQGEFMGKHRKIKPTASERVIWGEGNGTTLTTFDTRVGLLGGLICWENYMPLARMSMYQKGVEVYIAPTADARDNWQSTMIHIANEGRCYVIGCNQFVTKADYPADLTEELAGAPAILSRGGSVIVSPMGQVLAGPLFDEAGILIAEIDLAEVVKARMDFDVTGHYSRDDIFLHLTKDQPETQSDE
jgi:nitrilase